MLDYRNALEIRHDDNSTFYNYKKEGLDFTRDSFTIALDKDDDYLMIGFYKPINSIYLEFETPNTASGAITAEYYNGTEFTTLSEFYDMTDNFNRNGFMTWTRDQENEDETTIDSKECYWYRFSTSVTHESTVFTAINLLFSDDQALKLKFSKILSEEFLDGESNHNKVHAAARDEIVETFRRRGYLKSDTLTDASYANVTAWDMHDIYEVKEASTYLALTHIFFDFSDDPDDIWMEKSDRYKELYKENMNLARLSVDVDDDGIMDDSENLVESNVRYITR